MAPKPGTRKSAKNPVILSYTDEELQEQMKQNAAQQMLSVTGFPRAIWQSIRFTSGVRKQGEILKERIRQKAGGDKVEMERLEHELDMTEEELDLEASHFDELAERLSPAQQTKLAETMKEIRALEEVKTTLRAEEVRRINLSGDDKTRLNLEHEFDESFLDNTPPASPRDGAFDDDEMEGKYGGGDDPDFGEDPFVAEPDAPKGYWERDTGGNYWGDWLEREPGIEMQALSKAEAPFGANVSRVLKVGKKFAPKVTAKLEQMGSEAVKKMGWVAESLDQGGHVGGRALARASFILVLRILLLLGLVKLLATHFDGI